MTKRGIDVLEGDGNATVLPYLGWQTMDTAPKDGTDVIVAEGRLVSVAFFFESGGRWLDSMNHDGYEHADRSPTAWMPLPEPPKEEK